MVRRGWTQIEVSEGLTQIIRGRRPPCMGSAIHKPFRRPTRRHPARASQHRRDSPKWPSPSGIAGVGTRGSVAKTALVEAINSAKAEVPKPVHPQQKVADAAARVGRLEAAARFLGEDDPDAEPLKVALK